MRDFKDITKLDDFESEDIGDIVFKLEKSFGLKFDKNAFIKIKTFGDLCDVFEAHLQQKNCDDCTKQQAFYKIRKAISATQLIDEQKIKPGSDLIELFPRHDRRQKVKELQCYLGFKINILTYPDWLALIFGIGFLLSLIAFFFAWKIAVSGILFFILAMKIATRFGKDLSLKTIRQLTEKVAKENYIDVRRSKNTVNRKEVLATIIDTFSNDLYIDKDHLTMDAKFSWT